MNRLARRIAAIIEAEGPIGIDTYMRLCLFDGQDGYYTTREPFGVDGDFTTAPEISQMFGELVGVWVRLAWDALGRPGGVSVAEIGPGRGTLMRDIARTLGQLAPDLLASGRFALVEASARLVTVQKQTLSQTGPTFEWYPAFEALPPGPQILVANELFDALPVRQFVARGGGWHERVVGLGPDGALAFGAGPPVEAVPGLPRGMRDGAVFEFAPERQALMSAICGRIASEGGAALLIDYGHRQPGPGDTLQALRRHRPVDPLQAPGECDLTTHVDFHALATVARSMGLAAATLTQAEFLLGLGLLERAGRLGEKLNETGREAVRAAVERLAGPDQMGTLFKAMAVMPPGRLVPPFAPSPA